MRRVKKSFHRKRLSPVPNHSPDLSDLLLLASLSKSLSGPDAITTATASIDPSDLPISLPNSAVLPLLRRRSIPTSSKIDLLRILSPSPSFFSAVLLSLPPSSSDIVPVLRLAVDSNCLDHFTFSSLLRSLVLSSRFDDAIETLNAATSLSPQLLSSNDGAYTSLIVALIRKSQLSLAFSLFRNLFIRSGIVPNHAVRNELLSALRRADRRSEFHKLFDELSQLEKHKLDSWGFNTCIHAFGYWGDLGRALKLFHEMETKDIFTYNSVIAALCSAGKISDAISVFDELKVSGHEPDIFTYRFVIRGCCSAYRIDEAMRVFKEMEDKAMKADTVIYNNLLDGLMKVRKLDEACQMFEKMVSSGIRASCYTFGILIDGLIRNDRPAAGIAMFNDLKKKGGQLVNGITYSIVVSHLCKKGRVGPALEMVDEMGEKGFAVDLVTITEVLIALHKNERWDSAERLMKHVHGESDLLQSVLHWRAGVEASMRSPQDRGRDFSYMFPSNGSLKDVASWMLYPQKEINGKPKCEASIDEWSSSPYLDRLAEQFQGFSDGLKLYKSARGKRVWGVGFPSFDVDMVNTYMSVFLSKGKLSIACKLFEMLGRAGKEPVTYTYNALLTSFVKKGYMGEAWGLLQDMERKLCPGDVATYNLVIHGLGKMGESDLATTVLDRFLEHGGFLDTVMYNTLINVLGKAGKVRDANKLFDQMMEKGINPDVVTFNTMIEIHAKVGLVKEAYKLLRKMLAAGVSPNNVTDTILDFMEKEIKKQRDKISDM